MNVKPICSLSWEKAMGIALKNGLPALKQLNEMAARYEQGKEWSQQTNTLREMQEDLPEIIKLIEKKEIRVVSNAFNSNPSFITSFEMAAIATISLVLLDTAKSIERIGAGLDGIRSELAIENVSRVRGWSGDGFGGYVHLFVKNEMASVHDTEGDEKHFFYVWNPDSDWYPNFEERQKYDPLGPSFGGYHHDLPTICLRMRADRQALITTTDYGHTAVFHLIIPAYYPLAIDTPISFARELLPLAITGSRHRGTDLVWLTLDEDEDEDVEKPSLNFIGILPEVENLLLRASPVGIIGFWLAGFVSVIAAGAFPPCAPVAGPIASSCVASWVASAGTHIAAGIYEDCTRKKVEVLGDALFLD
ncbi:hypothetical protein F53441_4730 [Fusarium austroafricanum]|uniref:Uncharacterized protein n=1 Tax=Fusarium austroafricanum TaxID=2364996 RepID=A0A8H4KLU1_9HYPO|nr:hypothetical protein F53441_4730 [Fusarium austroafricanum]